MTDAIRKLRIDHADFVTLFREVEEAVETADAPTVQMAWSEFENRLLRHIEAEEEFLLPGLERAHPEEVARVRKEHERFRSLLDELGVCCDLHLLRRTAADELLALLRSHAAREDETLYKWAESELGEEHRSALLAAQASAPTVAKRADFSHILVPLDFGESSERALDLAVDLSKKFGASVTILHAYELPVYAYPGISETSADLMTPVRDAARRAFDQALAALRKRLPEARGILGLGVPWREILRTIDEEHIDLVVMGTHGRSGFGRALLGSVAEKTVRLSPVPVLTVRCPTSGGNS